MLPLLLIGFGLAGMAAAAWGFHSIQREITWESLSRPADDLKGRFAVDPYVWSESALPRHRRRYILTQACFPPAALCLGALCWTQDPSPERAQSGAMMFGALALVCGAWLAWKVLRHGFSLPERDEIRPTR